MTQHVLIVLAVLAVVYLSPRKGSILQSAATYERKQPKTLRDHVRLIQARALEGLITEEEAARQFASLAHRGNNI